METIPYDVFSQCEILIGITIPNSVYAIGQNAFSRCPGLTSITIGNRVTIIDERAFEFCPSLYSITIPDSVTTIGEGAFQFCPFLTSVTFAGTIPSNGFAGEYGYGYAFYGDLRAKFYATNPANGTPGTYTRPDGGSETWTRQ
jgi:hypothetical protein